MLDYRSCIAIVSTSHGWQRAAWLHHVSRCRPRQVWRQVYQREKNLKIGWKVMQNREGMMVNGFFPRCYSQLCLWLSWFLEKIIQENMIQFVESNRNKITICQILPLQRPQEKDPGSFCLPIHLLTVRAVRISGIFIARVEKSAGFLHQTVGWPHEILERLEIK